MGSTSGVTATARIARDPVVLSVSKLCDRVLFINEKSHISKLCSMFSQKVNKQKKVKKKLSLYLSSLYIESQ